MTKKLIWRWNLFFNLGPPERQCAPAVERTLLPERIVFFGGRHCSNKIVSAPGNWRPDYHCIIGKASKEERVFYSHADRKGRSPPLTVIFW